MLIIKIQYFIAERYRITGWYGKQANWNLSERDINADWKTINWCISYVLVERRCRPEPRMRSKIPVTS